MCRPFVFLYCACNAASTSTVYTTALLLVRTKRRGPRKSPTLILAATNQSINISNGAREGNRNDTNAKNEGGEKEVANKTKVADTFRCKIKVGQFAQSKSVCDLRHYCSLNDHFRQAQGLVNCWSMWVVSIGSEQFWTMEMPVRFD